MPFPNEVEHVRLQAKPALSTKLTLSLPSFSIAEVDDDLTFNSDVATNVEPRLTPAEEDVILKVMVMSFILRALKAKFE